MVSNSIFESVDIWIANLFANISSNVLHMAEVASKAFRNACISALKTFLITLLVLRDL